MTRDNEAEYLARREQDELMLAVSSPDPVARRLHDALAQEYRSKLDRLSVPAASEDRTPLITTALSVDTVDGEVVLSGQLPVAAVMTPEAAIDTGVELIQAALKAESDALKYR